MKKILLGALLLFNIFLLIGCSGNDSVLVKDATKKAIWDEIVRSCGMEGFQINYQNYDDGEMSILAQPISTAYASNFGYAYGTIQTNYAKVYVTQKGNDVVIKAIMKDGYYSWKPVDNFVDKLAEKYEITRGYSE